MLEIGRCIIHLKVVSVCRNKINIGGKKYYIEQVNAKTVSISVSKSPAIISNRNSEIFAIKGDLSSLFKINGGGMIVTILEMIPAYKASKDLLNIPSILA